MNTLTSQQRKLVYLAGIVLLLIPIIWLGMPASGAQQKHGRAESSGGKLAQLRQQYELGETSLGNVDPSSATMNLVLLGLRGIATDLLWIDAIEQQKTKNWAQLRANIDSIILLEPHYLKVWQFQGWNLAYNVSVEWDSIADRYYWVKEGGKFLMKGTARNRRYPELYWETGRVLGQKIGRADEWRFFRKFFKVDPDAERFKGGPDPEFSQFGGRQFDDNYLAAKYWFQLANDREETHEQHIQMRMLFRQYPMRSQMDYADALQREGYFDEVTRIAWEDAYDEWTGIFGQETFVAPAGRIKLEATEADIKRMALENNTSQDEIRNWVIRYQNICNYRYWRTRALSEAEPETVAAHREIFQGERDFRESKIFPDRYRAIAEKCNQAAQSDLTKAQLAVIKILCETGEPFLTHNQLAENEALKQAQLGEDALRAALVALVEKKLVEQILCPAKKKLQSGMRKFEALLKRHPALQMEDSSIEEALMAFIYWKNIHTLNGEKLPEDFPLRELVLREQVRLPQLEREFRRENRESTIR